METMTAKGIDGQISFDGTTVTITRTGFAARSMRGMAGAKSLKVSAITAIQFRAANAMINGFVSFVVPGEVSSSRSGSAKAAAQKDENAVIFRKSHMAEMKPLVDAIQAAISSPPSPAQAPGQDPMEQLRQLAKLKDEGLITDEEYEVKRAQLLDRI